MSIGMRSALYTGTIRHRRRIPVENSFRYGIYQLLLDLDELPRLDREVLWFGHNRAAVASFHDRDHMGDLDAPVREKLERWLAGRGVTLGDRRVTLLTNLRVLGYVFNPVSYFFCGDAGDASDFVVAEVNNTFGETYCYLLEDGEPVGRDATRWRRRKAFHVSPFMEIEGVTYDWIATRPGERLTVHVDERHRGEKYFDATLALERRPLTSASLGGALLRYPHLTARTIALIHWQALKLWWKGAPFHRKPPPPPNGLEVAERTPTRVANRRLPAMADRRPTVAGRTEA